MKIVLLSDTLLHLHPNITGSIVQIYNLGQVLKEGGHEVHYIYSKEKVFEGFDYYASTEAVYSRIPKGLFNWLFAIVRYTKILNQMQPKVLYTRGRSIFVFIASRWARKNNGKHIWATNGEDSCEKWKRIKRIWKSRKSLIKKIILTVTGVVEDIFIHRGMLLVHAVVNQTEYQKERLLQNWGIKGEVLPSIYRFESDPNIEKENLILWLANLNSGKGPETFINLLSNLKGENHYQFALVGGTMDKSYGEEIRRLAESVPNLTIVGAIPISETNKWFRRARIFINTSAPNAEGLPNTFIQAWMNNAVVVSLHHDPGNWLSKEGIGVYTNHSEKELLDKTISLMNDTKSLNQIANSAYNFANRYFNYEKVANQYLDFISTHG